MSVEQQFLDDILANPDDDGIRLIYADWLEDNEDPDRAELFRCQLERARLTRHDPRYDELEEREAELIARHKERWGGRAARYVDDYDFWRGMVESVVAPLAKFNRNAARLFALAPVDTLALDGFNSDRMAGVARCRHLARIRYLALGGRHLYEGDVLRLVASPYLGSVRILDLSGHPVGEVGLRVLVQSPLGGQLESLKVSRIAVNDEGAVALAQGRTLRSLEALDLSENVLLGPAGIEALAGAATLPRLRSLNLGQNATGALGPCLGRAPWLATLEDLHLDECNMGPEVLQALADNPAFRPRELTLSGSRAGPAVDALARSDALSRVEWLDLGANGLGARGVAALTRSKAPPALARLWLSQNDVGDAEVTALAGWPGLARVHDLRLAFNEITARGLHALLESPYLGCLRRLNLHGNKLGDRGARVLAGWSGLPQLRYLDLEENGITEKGKTALLGAWSEASGLRV